MENNKHEKDGTMKMRTRRVTAILMAAVLAVSAAVQAEAQLVTFPQFNLSTAEVRLAGERTDLEWKEDTGKEVTILKSVTVPDYPIVIKMFPKK